MKPMTYVIVRKKNDPTAPRVTATPESVDLDLFDVLDEHGNLVREEVLEEIRKIQAPPEPPPKEPSATEHWGKAQTAPAAPQHAPQHATTTPQHATTPHPAAHETAKRK